MLKIYHKNDQIVFDYGKDKEVLDSLYKWRGNTYARFKARKDDSIGEVMVSDEQLKVLESLGIKIG